MGEDNCLWIVEWPTLDKSTEQLLLQLKRRQLTGSFNTAKKTLELLSEVLSTVEWATASEIIHKVRTLGLYLTKSYAHELAIGNIVRRVLHIIREEYANSAQKASKGTNGLPLRTLGTILTPGTETDMSMPSTDLKGAVLEGIAELSEEIEALHVNIAEQAMEYIHTDEVILTYGMSTSVQSFLQTAAKKRDFKVIVVESSPSLNGQEFGHKLAESGIDVTIIPDSAVFAMMARVNKVVVPVAAVVANGGLVAQSGLSNIAMAAKKCSVPVVCIAGIIKLCPLYIHDIDVLNQLLEPSQILNYEDTVENLEVVNPAYDYVPPEFVSLYITNTGAHQPSYIYRLLAEYYAPQDYQLH